MRSAPLPGYLLLAALPALYVLIGRTYRARVYAELHHHWNAEHSASLESLALAVVATLVLWLLYRYVRDGRPGRAFVVMGGLSLAIMLGTAIVAEPDDNDAYIYVGYGVLQHFSDAYAPPREPLAPAFSEVNRRWSSPLVACVYGPLWLAADRVVLTGAESLEDGLLRIKLFAAVAYLVFLWLVFRLVRSAALLTTIALNPALINEFVERAHNDLLAVVCCLLAMMALARRWVPVALALVIAAGLIKISFVAAGAVVFARWGKRWQRMAVLAGVAIAVYTASKILGGQAYFTAMHAVAVINLHDLFGTHVIRLTLAHVAAIASALVALACAVFANRWRASAGWAFGSLSSAHLSWYLSWGIPYVLLAPASWATAAFFVGWPVAESLIEAPFGRCNAALYLGLAALIPIAEFVRRYVPIRRRAMRPLAAVARTWLHGVRA